MFRAFNVTGFEKRLRAKRIWPRPFIARVRIATASMSEEIFQLWVLKDYGEYLYCQ
jgi:hypothetical protein